MCEPTADAPAVRGFALTLYFAVDDGSNTVINC